MTEVVRTAEVEPATLGSGAGPIAKTKRTGPILDNAILAVNFAICPALDRRLLVNPHSIKGDDNQDFYESKAAVAGLGGFSHIRVEAAAAGLSRVFSALLFPKLR